MKTTLAWGVAGVLAASAAAVLVTGGAALAQPDHRTAGAAQQVVLAPSPAEIDADELSTNFDELWEWSESVVEQGPTVDTSEPFVIDPETLTPEELEAIQDLPSYED